MKKTLTALISFLLFQGGVFSGLCAAQTDSGLEEDRPMRKELILLAAPGDNDAYYADVKDHIFEFHVSYGRSILKQDDLIIFTGRDSYDKYVNALGEKHVVPIEMLDIWMRDYSPQNAQRPIMMRYSAEGQGGGRGGQSQADAVQDKFWDLIDKSRLAVPDSDLINDGGNFVEDGTGNAVLSRKFLRDNGLSETTGREVIRKISGVKNVAFIEADEQGGLEHADGVVAFIADNVLVINAYPEDPDYAADLRKDLQRGLPDVTIHEIITPYNGDEIYDDRFGSACGLYTNMLVTPNTIYLPQFGIPEDKDAFEKLKQWSDKQIIPVSSAQVCQMGGGVRCMSAQFRGVYAQKLANFLRNQ